MIWQNIVGTILLIASILLWNTNPFVPLGLLICSIIFLIIGIKKLKTAMYSNPNTHSSDNKTSSPSKKATVKIKYVINPQTMVIHRSNCRYVKASYSVSTHHTDNLQAALDIGYKRCKYCNPK